MSDRSAVKGLRERLATSTEDRLGRALSDLLDNPLLTGAVGRAFDAREKAAQAQELAMGALNLPSAADIERLTRRLRSLSQRLEGIEDGVDRISRSLSAPKVEARLEKIEGQLQTLTNRLSDVRAAAAASPTTERARRTNSKRSPMPSDSPSPLKKTAPRKAAPRSPAEKPPG